MDIVLVCFLRVRGLVLRGRRPWLRRRRGRIRYGRYHLVCKMSWNGGAVYCWISHSVEEFGANTLGSSMYNL